MPRPLNTTCLDNAAREWAAAFLQPSVFAKNRPDFAIGGRAWVMQNLYNATFKDVHEYLVAKIKGYLGPDALKEFEEECGKKFTPRSDETFRKLLAEKLAIDENGKHIPGKVGTVEVGRRPVGKRINQHGRMKVATWPIYAGEEEEREAGSDAVDPLPPPNKIFHDIEHLGPVTKGD